MILRNSRLYAAAVTALWALSGAGVSATICWLWWCVTTPGDDFANGSGLVGPSLMTALLAGGYAAYRLRGRRFRTTLTVMGLLCVSFWICVRDDWWVHPPPPMPQAEQAERGTPAAAMASPALGSAASPGSRLGPR